MSKVKSPWDQFSFTGGQQQSQQQPVQRFTTNRGGFVPQQNNTFQGGRTTNPAARWQTRKPQQTQTTSRNAQQSYQPWGQQQAQPQVHPQLYQHPGDLMPSYYEPQMFVDEHGNMTPTPTPEQWIHRHAVRSVQVGVGTALIHFGEGLVQAYLPWKNK